MTSPQHSSHSQKPWALCRLLSLILPARIVQAVQRLFRSTPQISIDGPSESRATHHLDTPNVPEVRVSSCDECHRTVTINILPDDVLLLIFHFVRMIYLGKHENFNHLGCLSWRWHRLVHVSRRWRSVVFGSSNFLDLKLVCRPWTRVELIDTWPPFPISVKMLRREDYRFVSAIMHRNSRVCEIELHISSFYEARRLASALQEPFPELVHLKLSGCGSSLAPPVLPDGFLSDSAPRLQSLEFDSVPSPVLPKFLLSATSLVRLNLGNIPTYGYISPEAIVTGLAVLVNLKFFAIGFLPRRNNSPHRESLHPPLPPRTVLPALTHIQFQGVSEYLEDLVSRIDAPLLDTLWISFLHQLVEIPQIAQFMDRTTRLQVLNEAHVVLDHIGFQVNYLTRTLDPGLRISCPQLLSSSAQDFTSFFPSIYMVEDLYITGAVYLPSQLQDDFNRMRWLEILRPFTAVENLYVCKEFARCIAAALQELIEERVTNVLPALKGIFFEGLQPSGPIQEDIGKFVPARQLSGRHPITVSIWERDRAWEVGG